MEELVNAKTSFPTLELLILMDSDPNLSGRDATFWAPSCLRYLMTVRWSHTNEWTRKWSPGVDWQTICVS